MKYLTWILENKLATRPGPIEIPWDIDELVQAGIKVIISLSNEKEKESIKGSIIKHYKYYTNDIPLHDEEDIHGFVMTVKDAVDIIHQEIEKEQAVMVHCHAGRDRSGFLVAAYLVKYLNKTAPEALRIIRQKKDYCVYPGYSEAVLYYQKLMK